ncbi:hypothetical protein V1477_006401 [Vespula maculifrons]|uniref:Uncharacterized protein n=1 Tax=Vespula maculifrons TaxID=7453 RepID=A0ABD2CK96_VESMC
MCVEDATSSFKRPRLGSPRCYSSGEKNCKRKIFFPLFPLNRYNSAPIGPISTQKIWETRRALSNNSGAVLLGAIVSEKKILKEKCFFPLFPLDRYNSWARRALSTDPGPVLVGAIVSEKKIFPLNSYNSAPIGPICTQKIWA